MAGTGDDLRPSMAADVEECAKLVVAVPCDDDRQPAGRAGEVRRRLGQTTCVADVVPGGTEDPLALGGQDRRVGVPAPRVGVSHAQPQVRLALRRCRAGATRGSDTARLPGARRRTRGSGSRGLGPADRGRRRHPQVVGQDDRPARARLHTRPRCPRRPRHRPLAAGPDAAERDRPAAGRPDDPRHLGRRAAGRTRRLRSPRRCAPERRPARRLLPVRRRPPPPLSGRRATW